MHRILAPTHTSTHPHSLSVLAHFTQLFRQRSPGLQAVHSLRRAFPLHDDSLAFLCEAKRCDRLSDVIRLAADGDNEHDRQSTTEDALKRRKLEARNIASDRPEEPA